MSYLLVRYVVHFERTFGFLADEERRGGWRGERGEKKPKVWQVV